MFEDILGGFVTLFSDDYAIWFVVLAAFVGIVFGALPGLTAAAAIAMMLPILIAYNDEIGGLAGLAFLYVIGKSGRYGGSIAAILFNTPGTAASAATMQDGYPMTRSGRAGKALKEGKGEDALRAARECTARALPLGDWWGTAMGLSAEGRALAMLGKHEESLAQASQARLILSLIHI